MLVVVVFTIFWCFSNQDDGCCFVQVNKMLVVVVVVSYLLVFRLSRCWLLLLLCLLTVGIQVIKMLVVVVVVFVICWYLGNQDVGCCCSCVCYLLVFRLSRCWLLLQLCLLTVGIQVIKMLVVVVVVFVICCCLGLVVVFVFAICWYLGYQDVDCCCCFSFLFVLRLSRCWLLLLLCLLTVGVQVIKMLVVVVVVFAICWLPWQLYHVVGILYPAVNRSAILNKTIFKLIQSTIKIIYQTNLQKYIHMNKEFNRIKIFGI